MIASAVQDVRICSKLDWAETERVDFVLLMANSRKNVL
jgi:hypothetical protein